MLLINVILMLFGIIGFIYYLIVYKKKVRNSYVSNGIMIVLLIIGFYGGLMTDKLIWHPVSRMTHRVTDEDFHTSSEVVYENTEPREQNKPVNNAKAITSMRDSLEDSRYTRYIKSVTIKENKVTVYVNPEMLNSTHKHIGTTIGNIVKAESIINEVKIAKITIINPQTGLILIEIDNNGMMTSGDTLVGTLWKNQ